MGWRHWRDSYVDKEATGTEKFGLEFNGSTLSSNYMIHHSVGSVSVAIAIPLFKIL